MGYAIPVPQDPREAQAWRRAVKSRQERELRESTERLLAAQDLVLIPLSE
jgi:hypothetical protein